MTSTTNRTIAKNTLFLYARKLFTLVMALYTSRVLLQQLGVTDFGIYGLVGSVVAMFSALRTIFSSSIQRYINVAKGNDSGEEVNAIFSIGVKIHRWIALGFFIVVEIGGTIMMHYLDIPSEKYYASYLVMQFSIITAVVTILTVPYDALIIANEKFNAFAIFSIIDYSLRLGVVFMLAFSDENRMVLYAALLFIEAIIVRLINVVYCRKVFGEECRYRKVHRPDLLKQMTGFAGWQFLGNTAYTVTNNGINFVLNLMGGVVVNAARTLAYQAMSAISQFIGDLSLSFQPRTMMLYAQGDMSGFHCLIYLNSKANLAMALILAFPIVILAEPVVYLWLGEIPPYTIGFIRAVMVYLLLRSLHTPIDLYFKSYGNMKAYQIIELCILTLSLPLSWVFLHFGLPFYTVFLAMSMCELFNLAALLILARHQHKFSIRRYCREVGARSVVCVAFFAALVWLLLSNFSFDDMSFSKLVMSTALFVLGAILIVVLTLFSPRELGGIISLIKK